VLVDAVGWVRQFLLGNFATAIAVLAIASLGYLLLAGRIDYRRGMRVILGCFILFGAPRIADELLSVGARQATPGEAPLAVAGAPPASPLPPATPNGGQADNPFERATMPAQPYRD
jgi:hypothetical protein